MKLVSEPAPARIDEAGVGRPVRKLGPAAGATITLSRLVLSQNTAVIGVAECGRISSPRTLRQRACRRASAWAPRQGLSRSVELKHQPQGHCRRVGADRSCSSQSEPSGNTATDGRRSSAPVAETSLFLRRLFSRRSDLAGGIGTAGCSSSQSRATSSSHDCNGDPIHNHATTGSSAAGNTAPTARHQP